VKRAIPVLLLFAATALFAQPSEVALELRVGRDLAAPVVRGAIDADGKSVWLATHTALYRAADGRAQFASKRPSDEAVLELAPGGAMYAWVIPDSNIRGPVTRIRLHSVEGELLAELKTEPAAGTEFAFLGFRGGTIMTAAPLQDPEGARGPFRYTFWSRDGQRLASTVLDERPNVVFAQDGSAVAILGEKATHAFTSDGKAAWTVEGAFRKAALCCGARRAVLNPSRKGISAIVFVDSGQIGARSEIPTPVHHLAMSPEGDVVIAAGDRGRWFTIIPGARPREGRKLTSGRLIPYIFDLEVPDSRTVLFGILNRAGEQRGAGWPSGSIVGVRRDGTVIFRRDFEIGDPSGLVPAVDVAPGANVFIGRTRETAFLGVLKGN
jgi:hypothetical protein